MLRTWSLVFAGGCAALALVASVAFPALVALDVAGAAWYLRQAMKEM